MCRRLGSFGQSVEQVFRASVGTGIWIRPEALRYDPGGRYGFSRACVSGVVSATRGSITVPVML
jgi:hypothetical protein